MSREIQRSNQEVFFLDNQDGIQEPLKRIFQRCSKLFSKAQELFPETKMRVEKDFNLPYPGFSQLGHGFTFNFGLEEPRSVFINGERDYTLKKGKHMRYTDEFFRFMFIFTPTEELSTLLNQDRLSTHNPSRLFVQRTDLGGYEMGVEWILREVDEAESMEEPERKLDPFPASASFLEKLYTDINRPVTGINTVIINEEVREQIEKRHFPLTGSLYYPETRKASED